MKVLLLTLLFFTVGKTNGQNLPYTSTTEFGLLIGQFVKTTLTFQTFNGVRFKKQDLQLGINTGVDQYNNLSLVPLSLGVKWNPKSEKTVSPIFSLSGGYGFSWLEKSTALTNYRGGTLFNSSVGLKVKTGPKLAMDFSIGFKQQKASISQNYVGQYFLRNKDSFVFRRAAVTIGVSF